VTVTVFERHAGLTRAAQAAQRHHPRACPVGRGQPGMKIGEQALPAGQKHRPRHQPHRLTRHCPTLILQPDSCPAVIGIH